MKPLLLLVSIALVLAILYQAKPAWPQTEFMVVCQGGVCQMRESDLLKLQQIINALVERLQELQGKTGCS